MIDSGLAKKGYHRSFIKLIKSYTLTLSKPHNKKILAAFSVKMALTVSRRKHDITKKIFEKLFLVYNCETGEVSQVFSLKSKSGNSGAVKYFDDEGSIVYQIRPN